MGKENSDRIQSSLLSAGEKVILKYLADRQPRWMTSDILTYIGVFGAFVAAAGYVLGNVNPNYLWLSSFGFFINWYGDSLDGTLARVRQLQRPIYGFFIDHSLDGFATCVFCIGAAYSPVFRTEIPLLVLAGYLLLSIYTYVCTIIKDEFRLTYGGIFGPTEFRIIIVLLNVLYLYTPGKDINWNINGEVWTIFDVCGIIIAALLYIIFLCQFFRDRAILAKKDPAKKYNPDK